MSLLGKTVAVDRIVEVEYPDIEGFYIKLAYISREAMSKMLKRNSVIRINKVSRAREEEVDNDKFLAEYSESVIKDWKGLKFKDLARLYPADIADFDPEDEVPYAPENALVILENSSDFNTFLTDATNDVTAFQEQELEKAVKN